MTLGLSSKARAMAARWRSPPGERGHPVVSAVGKADEFQDLGSLPVSPRMGVPGNQSRHGHIFQSGKLRQKMVKLEDKADAQVSEAVLFGLVQKSQILSAKKNLAGCRLIQCS